MKSKQIIRDGVLPDNSLSKDLEKMKIIDRKISPSQAQLLTDDEIAEILNETL